MFYLFSSLITMENIIYKFICDKCSKGYKSSEKHYNIHIMNCTGKQKKTSIKSSLKKQVWDVYIGTDIGKAKCLCCKNNDISQLDFHCGHVLSEANGGLTDVTNLRPICQKCNLSMGTTNLHEFAKILGNSDEITVELKKEEVKKENIIVIEKEIIKNPIIDVVKLAKLDKKVEYLDNLIHSINNGNMLKNNLNMCHHMREYANSYPLQISSAGRSFLMNIGNCQNFIFGNTRAAMQNSKGEDKNLLSYDEYISIIDYIYTRVKN